MKISLFRFKPISVALVLTFAICQFAPMSLAAQDDDPPADVAPPSMKAFSKDEKKLIEAEKTNAKKRTKISLELMEVRMVRAESHGALAEFKETLDELGAFHALLDNTLDFLLAASADDRRFITFEIYLRRQIPRLETMRRAMPYKFGYHVEKLMKAVRDARSRAVEPIFSDTVVPDSPRKP